MYVLYFTVSSSNINPVYVWCCRGRWNCGCHPEVLQEQDGCVHLLFRFAAAQWRRYCGHKGQHQGRSSGQGRAKCCTHLHQVYSHVVKWSRFKCEASAGGKSGSCVTRKWSISLHKYTACTIIVKNILLHVFFFQIAEHMWCPTSLVVNGKETQYPLPEPYLPLNFFNSTGMRYQAEEVRQCLLKGTVTFSIF